MVKNRFRKIVSLILVTSIILTSIIQVIIAADQLSIDELYIDEVYYVEGENAATGEATIEPTISISWDIPDSWDSDDDDDDDYYEPDYYNIVLNNITMDDETDFSIDDDSDEYVDQALDIEDFEDLETGSLYEIQVEPVHYEEDDDGVSTAVYPDEDDTYDERQYALTDFDVEFVADEDSIQVIWEDVGPSEFEYRIVYALGDYSDDGKDTLIENKDGEITDLTNESDDVTAYTDTDDGRDKLLYTIDEGLVPGQIYSVMVESTTEYYDGRDIYYNSNDPIINLTSTDATLELTDEGEFIRLDWDIPDSFVIGSSSDSHTIQEAILYEIVDGVESTLVSFEADAVEEGYYKLEAPIEETTYYMEFYYDNNTSSDGEVVVESTEVTYTPDDLIITPSAPEVPDLMTEDIVDNWDDDEDDISDYLVDDYTYDGNIDDILDENVTYHVIENDSDITDSSINLVWGAFTRLDTSEDSDTYGEYIYDNNVYYDIWVTDSYGDLDTATRVEEDLKYDSTDTDNILENDDEDIVGYTIELDQYYSSDEGTIVDGIEPNNIYYIKITATKISNDVEYTSQETIVSVYFDYEGNYYEPPTISDPPLSEVEDETTETSITIQWEETWFEIYSPDYDDEDDFGYDWAYAETVWVDEDGYLYDEEIDDGEEFDIYRDEDEILDLQEYLLDEFDITLYYRELSLESDDYTEIGYKFLSVEYTDVTEDDETISEYIEYLVELDDEEMDDGNDSIFEYIDVTEDDDILYYTEDDLESNTSYVFFLYPYRILLDDTELTAAYPTPIVVTTDSESEDIDADPSVPTLEIESEDLTEIELEWEYNLEFDYTIYYGTEDDVDEGTEFEFELPDEDDDEYPEDGEEYNVTVDDLFPETDYYFWIMATNSDTDSSSDWSNSVMGTTDDVEAPEPPNGIGIASDDSVEDYDLDEAVGDDYVVIEWVLDDDDDYDDDDDDDDDDSSVTITYYYILEFADNSKFISADYILTTGGIEDVEPDSVTILDKNLVEISDLISDTDYYVRMKTKIIVEGSDDDQYIEVESDDYSDTVKVTTDDSNDEYDGSVDPIYEVLPDEDYELAYDDDTETLYFRFRSDEIDDAGERDNYVDQRLISDLIDENTYVYEIDLSEYKGYEITNRIIEIPYTVIKAFNDYRIDISIDAGDLNVVLPENMLEYEINRQKNLFGVAPTVTVNIDEVDEINEDLPIQSMGYSKQYEDIEIIVSSDTTYKNLHYGDKPMTLSFDSDERDSVVYTFDYREDWIREESYLDWDTDLITVETSNIGTYVFSELIGTEGIEGSEDHWSDEDRDKILEDYYIIGLEDIESSDEVSEQAVVNIIYAIVAEVAEVDLTAKIHPKVSEILYKSNIKENDESESSAIDRQEVISMFVRAYELEKGKSINASEYYLDTVVEDGTTSSIYSEDVANALTIGLMADEYDIRATDAMTYGELFSLWSRY